MSTQKNLITLCAAAALTLGLAACGGGSTTTTPTMPPDPDPDLTLAGVQMAMAVEAGTYRISDDLADALDNADPADAALLGVDHAEGTTIEVAGLMLTCGAGPCRVTVNDDGTVTITGTIWTAGYMPPPTAEEVAAATEAAATKRTAIEAEALQTAADDAGLGGSAASTLAAGAEGSYELAIARDRAATTIAVTVNGATDDDDVTFAKAADLDGAAGHAGQMLTRTMDADADGNVMTEVAVVVTDIQAPMAVAFAMWEADLAGATPQALDTSTDTTNDTPDVTNEALAVDEASADALALVDSDAFSAGTAAQLTFDGDDPADDEDAAFTAAGTYRGAMGTYMCNGGATDCTVTLDAEGTITAMSDGWVFIPDEGATSDQPDYDYLHYGFWLKRTTDADGAVTYDEVETFAGSSVPASGSGVGAVTGTASYEGGAAGVYVRETYDPADGSVDTATSGHFTADARLTATFGQVPVSDTDSTGTIAPNLLNQLFGTIDNFVLSGGEENAWSVNLSSGAIDGATGTASGAANGGGAAGSWDATFHGPADADNQPHTVVGEFDANFGNGTVAGGFGARKQ